MLSTVVSISSVERSSIDMRTLVGVLSALLLMCSLAFRGQIKSGQPPAVPLGGALVLDLSGTVDVQDPRGKGIKVTRNMSLAQGTAIETGRNAKMLLRLEDGSEVLIGSQSRMVLKQEYFQSGKTIFELLLGRLKVVVTKRYTGSPSFQLGTPTAIVAVRGTSFYVEVNSHEVTEVDVDQGLVQVTSRKDLDDFVMVKAGFSTRVGPNTIPEAPSPTDSIRPDLREQQETDTPQDAPDGFDGRQSSTPDQQGPTDPNAPD
jgi:hypothetical protein